MSPIQSEETLNGNLNISESVESSNDESRLLKFNTNLNSY